MCEGLRFGLRRFAICECCIFVDFPKGFVKVCVSVCEGLRFVNVVFSYVSPKVCEGLCFGVRRFVHTRIQKTSDSECVDIVFYSVLMPCVVKNCEVSDGLRLCLRV